jgi:hypothetical protein
MCWFCCGRSFDVSSSLRLSRSEGIASKGSHKPVEQLSEKLCPVIYQGLTECVPAAGPPYHRSTRAIFHVNGNYKHHEHVADKMHILV